MTTATKCMWMRGGTSKGGYFLGADLPLDPADRNALLLRVMGSPDDRQIDGMGGGTPLTSKVAVVDSTWASIPTSSSTYDIMPISVRLGHSVCETQLTISHTSLHCKVSATSAPCLT